jgi:hypothetical protein
MYSKYEAAAYLWATEREIPAIEFYFEDYLADPDALIRRMQAFLGYPVTGPLVSAAHGHAEHTNNSSSEAPSHDTISTAANSKHQTNLTIPIVEVSITLTRLSNWPAIWRALVVAGLDHLVYIHR